MCIFIYKWPLEFQIEETAVRLGIPRNWETSNVREQQKRDEFHGLVSIQDML